MSLRPQRSVDLSQRARQMPASPIRKLVPFADAAKKRGTHIYHLNIGQPDIETPREMIDAYRGYDQKVLAYGHSAGLPEYRQALAEYYRHFDIHVDAEQVLVTTGGSEAILFTLMTLCSPGDNVLIPEPFYTNYLGFAVMAGVEVRGIPSRAEEGFHLPPRTVIEAHIDERTRAILYSSPGNPTGTVFERSELEVLRQLSWDHGLTIVADEVYREFLYDGGRHTSIFHLDGMEDRAVLVDSVSKRFSACGARVGCLLSRNEDFLEAALRLGQARLCPPTVDQIAAMAALKTPQSYLQNVRREYEQRRNVLLEHLEKIPGVRCTHPSGAFYLMVELPVDNSERFCQWILESFEHEGCSVMMAPGAGFYVTPDQGTREVRIAYVLKSQDLVDACTVLHAALAAYPGSNIM
jgi:aspartate aminotransferase